MEEIIKKAFTETLETMNKNLRGTLDRSTILLDSGLDSLGFAMLVVRLDAELGFDPFAESDQPFYPQTFGEFVDFYEAYANRGK